MAVYFYETVCIRKLFDHLQFSSKYIEWFIALETTTVNHKNYSKKQEFSNQEMRFVLLALKIQSLLLFTYLFPGHV